MCLFICFMYWIIIISISHTQITLFRIKQLPPSNLWSILNIISYFLSHICWRSYPYKNPYYKQPNIFIRVTAYSLAPKQIHILWAMRTLERIKKGKYRLCAFTIWFSLEFPIIHCNIMYPLYVSHISSIYDWQKGNIWGTIVFLKNSTTKCKNFKSKDR